MDRPGSFRCQHRDDADAVYVDATACFRWSLCELLRSRSRRWLCRGLLGRQSPATDEDQGWCRSEKYLQACPERAVELVVWLHTCFARATFTRISSADPVH